MEKLMWISDIREHIYARMALSEDRIEWFMDHYTNGSSENIPILEVCEDGRLIEGRHRLTALKRLANGSKQQIKVKIIPHTKELSDIDLLIMGMNKHMIGALPLSKKDYIKDFKILIEAKQTQAALGEKLNLPSRLINKYFRDARRDIENTIAIQAANEVRKGDITVEQASKKYNVSRTLINHFLGEKISPFANVNTAKAALTVLQKTYTEKLRNWFENLTKWYQSKCMSQDDISSIISHNQGLTYNISANQRNWASRFNHIFVETEKKN